MKNIGGNFAFQSELECLSPTPGMREERMSKQINKFKGLVKIKLSKIMSNGGKV